MLLNRRRFLCTGACAPFCHAAAPPSVRVSVTTDEIDEDVAVAARFLRGFGVHWAEVRSTWGRYAIKTPVERIREARSILNAHQVRVSVLDTPIFRELLPPDTPEGRKELDKEWDKLDAAFERAAILGTDCLRTFAFKRPASEPRFSGPVSRTEARIYELLREKARRAKNHGIRVAVENLEESYVSTGAESARMLTNVRDEWLGVTWDPTNAIGEGENAFPDGYRKLDPARIFNTHLRDYRRTPSGEVVWCAVGDGDFDNLGQIRALVKDGYKGTLNLETHYRHPDGKLAATRASLIELLKVVERI